MASDNVQRTLEAVWRIESAKIVAGLARRVRDVSLAEELAQEALLAAWQQWPEEGIPDNPAAWLTSVATRRALDHLRRRRRDENRREDLVRRLPIPGARELVESDQALDDPVGDDLLRLIFTTCHPVLPPEARAALTLRLLGGLTTIEIARAFVLPEPTIAQRIVRAKRTLQDSQVPFETPRAEELPDRLTSVLEVIYLIFNEGYAATSGADWMRPTLCEEAQRLARILAGLMPAEAEVWGLAALLDLQGSRAPARLGPGGQPVLLLEQNRLRWDQVLIRRGLAALQQAEQLAVQRGPYTLQAAIAACHARARRPEETDWERIAGLYGELGQIAPNPIVELNRGMALAMWRGPAAGLEVIDSLIELPELRSYAPLSAARGDLLFKLGRLAEARAEFLRAAELNQNAREQSLLRRRADECVRSESDPPADEPLTSTAD